MVRQIRQIRFGKARNLQESSVPAPWFGPLLEGWAAGRRWRLQCWDPILRFSHKKRGQTTGSWLGCQGPWHPLYVHITMAAHVCSSLQLWYHGLLNIENSMSVWKVCLKPTWLGHFFLQMAIYNYLLEACSWLFLAQIIWVENRHVYLMLAAGKALMFLVDGAIVDGKKFWIYIYVYTYT